MESITERLKVCFPADLQVVRPDESIVLIDEKNPGRFWGRLVGALENGSSAALLDPAWPVRWRQALDITARAFRGNNEPSILIPTSGSTGLPKFCIHTADTLHLAALGFRDLGHAIPVPHSVNVLPQHHIGGLMPVLRSAVSGGRVHFADYRDMESIRAAPFELEEAAISLVPTQLRRMRSIPGMRELLRRFAMILTGGAACPDDLLAWARENRLKLAPCYGSTETAAMVTMLPPRAFLAGRKGVGSALPHARIHILEQGRIAVTASSLFRGYHPVDPSVFMDPFPTGDIGQLDAEGNLLISGRADRVIISGGKKIHPEWVENAAMATGLLAAADCRGIADPDWGQRVELWIQSSKANPGTVDELKAHLRASLPGYARPKAIHLKSDSQETELSA